MEQAAVAEVEGKSLFRPIHLKVRNLFLLRLVKVELAVLVEAFPLLETVAVQVRLVQ